MVVSLHPLYDAEVAAFDEGLIGRWTSAEEQLTLEIEASEWRSYRVRASDGRQEVSATARLARLGEQLYLDVVPVSGADVPPLLVPVHAFYRVTRTDDSLAIFPLDYDDTERRARQGTLGIPTAVDERHFVILTERPSRLRAWIVGTAAPFAEPTVLHRDKTDALPRAGSSSRTVFSRRHR
jgi:hypothetical protein